MSATRVADEYEAIRQRLAEIERDKTAALNAEMPKAWPEYTAEDFYTMYGGVSCYSGAIQESQLAASAIYGFVLRQ